MKSCIIICIITLYAFHASSQIQVPDSTIIIVNDSLTKEEKAHQMIIDYHKYKEKHYDKELELLKQRIMILEDEVTYNMVNLKNAHNKFRRGIILIAGGSAAILLGSTLQFNTNRRRGRGGAVVTPSNALYFGGLITLATGVVITIDSHKYFGKAGKGTVYRNLP